MLRLASTVKPLGASANVFVENVGIKEAVVESKPEFVRSEVDWGRHALRMSFSRKADESLEGE